MGVFAMHGGLSSPAPRLPRSSGTTRRPRPYHSPHRENRINQPVAFGRPREPGGPLPHPTVSALDTWLDDRRRAGINRPALPAGRSHPLFVRSNGTALSEQTLDRIVRRLAHRAGVVLPTGAAAHAFRHHYGVTLALRGVPPAVISQLMGHADPRTTAIYTTVAATQLIAALDEAGLL
jgi:integrase